MSQSNNVKAGILAIEKLIETWGTASQRGSITNAEYLELLEEMQDRAETEITARKEETGDEDDVLESDD